MKVGEDFFAKEAGLLEAVVAPEFEHHLGASGGVILLELGDALLG
jgi:hypothetical protein